MPKEFKMDSQARLWLKIFSIPMLVVVIALPIQLWWFLAGGGTVFDRFTSGFSVYAHPLDWAVAIVSILGALFVIPFLQKGSSLPSGGRLFVAFCVIGMNILAILLEWGKILPGHGAVMSTMVVSVASLGNATTIVVFLFGKEPTTY